MKSLQTASTQWVSEVASDFHVGENGDFGNVKHEHVVRHIVRTTVASMSHPYIFCLKFFCQYICLKCPCQFYIENGEDTNQSL